LLLAKLNGLQLPLEYVQNTIIENYAEQHQFWKL